MAYLEALHSASSLRRSASSNSCLAASVRLHQCMCWMRFELQRMPSKLQPDFRDGASSSSLRAWLSTRYSSESERRRCRLGMRAVFFVARHTPGRGFGGVAPLHQSMWSTGLGSIADLRNCSQPLDLAHRPCSVLVAAIDRLRTEGSLSERRCR